MIKLVIPGRPVPKKRPRTSLAGRKMHVYTPTETSAYEKLVRDLAFLKVKKPFFEDIEVSIKLFFRNRRFGDIDNYAKSILDGMQEIVFENDKQVAKLHIERHIDEEERAEVEVKPIIKEVGA